MPVCELLLLALSGFSLTATHIVVRGLAEDESDLIVVWTWSEDHSVLPCRYQCALPCQLRYLANRSLNGDQTRGDARGQAGKPERDGI